jgi:perosamine synthetase
MAASKYIPVAEPSIGARELEYVTDAVRSGWVSSIGSYVVDFERAIGTACGAAEAVSTSSGTAALHLALAAIGVGPGDEVIVPSLTFIATANAVRYVGATPVFADSDPSHWCIDPADVARCVTARTRAIIPVHLYGHPADMDAITAIARPRGIAIIEDAAEALGTTYRGRPVGSIGDAGVFSFYGNKLITSGEGGMFVTGNKTLADRARLLRDHAMDAERRYWHDEIGFNFRMTNLQAALGVAQAERMANFLARKIEIANRYRDGLAGVEGIAMQSEAPWAGSSWWMSTFGVGAAFPVDRDEFARRLLDRGVDTRPAFLPLHIMPPYRTPRVLHTAQRIARRGISLPSGVSLTPDDQSYVIECVRDIAAGMDRRRHVAVAPVAAREETPIEREPLREAA